jgi:uncharacterized protein YwgA
MSINKRKGELSSLVRHLGISPRKLTAAISFNERLRVQKAVFLLKHLGIAPFTDYDFSLYVHGPYSPTLAADYYDVAKVKAMPMKLEPRVETLLNWFASKDERWLEIASSIISIKEKYPRDKNDAIHPLLKMSKPWVDRGTFNSVMTELESQGAV